MLHRFRTKNGTSVITPVVTGSHMIKIFPLQKSVAFTKIYLSFCFCIIWKKSAKITAKEEMFV